MSKGKGQKGISIFLRVRPTKKPSGYFNFDREEGKVDFETGSFSKALGVQGGILAGSEEVVVASAAPDWELLKATPKSGVILSNFVHQS